MRKEIKIIEVTKENENRYINQIARLEEKVLEDMEKKGKTGQLFITGKEDISEYINSKENTVMIAIDEKDEVIAATYITKGQKMFTYNDITKYFKTGEKYQEYVKSLYGDKYKEKIIDIYASKVVAYAYAKKRIKEELKTNKNFMQLVNEEVQKNGFHEKSEIREKLNIYMYEFMEEKGLLNDYEKFYELGINDIRKETDIENDTFEYIVEYEKILKLQQHKIYEKPQFDTEKYFKSNPENSIEIDTYITDPNNRHLGLARAIVYEGIKKYIIENGNKDMFLCSTLHRDNVSSKYVSEFFGLEDSLYVNRRSQRDREVHIHEIATGKSKEYLREIELKLAVLYNYNPENIEILPEEKVRILEQQLKYEINEINRLKGIKEVPGKFSGEVISKKGKIQKLEEKLIRAKIKIKNQERDR